MKTAWTWVCAALALCACGSSSADDGAQGAAGAAGSASGGAGTGGAAGSSGSAGAAGATSPCATSGIAPGTQTIQIENGGLTRSYILHVPKGYDASKPAPLILNFHGYTSNAAQEEGFTGMTLASDADGFVVAYPEGISSSWNAGVCCQFTTPQTDDVAFTRAVVADIENSVCVDAKRVYATGMSNGGYMSHRLGCEAADLFAAVAPVASVLGIPAADCNPSRPMPLIAFNGTADPLVPYDGGGTLGAPSVPDTFAGWGARDGCTGDPVQTFQNAGATCMTYKTCSAGVEVTECTVEGEGHCWPGSAICGGTLGAPSLDISANDEMWKFFQKFELPIQP